MSPRRQTDWQRSRQQARAALTSTRRGHDLRRRLVGADRRAIVDGMAPRLGPRELLGPPARRPQLLAKRDPLRTGGLWRWTHWAGLLLWAGVAGRAFRQAWRVRRAPRDQSTGTTVG